MTGSDATSVDTAAPSTPQPQPLFIGGQWRPASSGAVHPVRNAWTGEVVTEQAAAEADDVDAAVNAAHRACEPWAAMSGAQRAEILTAAAGALERHEPQIARAVTEETAGTTGWGMFNVGLAASILRAAGDAARTPLQTDVASEVPGLRSMTVRRPLGVCVAIAPWNAPVILATRSVAWPLAFGNTVVLKAAEQSPRVQAAVVAALEEAGIPAGVVNLITNDPADAPERVAQLVEHPLTRHVNFTGSSRVGAIIAGLAAPHFTRTLLELGGKAPVVVLDDADLDAAAAAVGFGAFMNSGQVCMSTERVIVDRAVHDAFTDRLVAHAGGLVVGSPFEADTMVGPVVDGAARRRVGELIDDAQTKGAAVLCGGDRDGLIAPTVLTGVRPEMRLYAEESFGPVVAVIAVDGDDEAVRVANDTEYGLSAAVFGTDIDRALTVAGRIESGICHVNGATVHDEASAPFGGVKASGWGRFGAGEVLQEFTDAHWVTVSEQPRSYPI